MQETHKEEACPKAKVGGDLKKGPFKLSPLDSVSVITDGVLSMQPTVLVSITSPPPAVNTHTHTLIWSLASKRMQERGVQKPSAGSPCLWCCAQLQERFQLDCSSSFWGDFFASCAHIQLAQRLPADRNLNECLWSRKMSFAQRHRKQKVPSDLCSLSPSVCLSLSLGYTSTLSAHGDTRGPLLSAQ